MHVTDLSFCSIMGTNIAAVDMEGVLEYLQKNLDALKGNYICVANVHTTVMGWRDPEYQSIQNSSAFAIPDGRPLSVVGNRRGYKTIARVTGPDLMEKIFSDERFTGYTHYFYGSIEETLSQLVQVLEISYPGIKIAGVWSPPFRGLTEEEDQADCKRINEAAPDFLWVGLGAPKQEKWMADHEGKVNSLMIGTGAGFDYFAGNIKRAPGWMQHMGLEWLYRLMQDPKRLFSRYFTTNFSFIYHAFLRNQ